MVIFGIDSFLCSSLFSVLCVNKLWSLCSDDSVCCLYTYTMAELWSLCSDDSVCCLYTYTMAELWSLCSDDSVCCLYIYTIAEFETYLLIHEAEP